MLSNCATRWAAERLGGLPLSGGGLLLRSEAGLAGVTKGPLLGDRGGLWCG